MQDEIAVKLTDAIVQQSVLLERNSRALEALEHRMAVQPSAPLFDPRTLVVRAILVAGVSALVGATVALAWVAP